MKKRFALLTLLVLVLGLVATALPASAGIGMDEDPNDTPGPLDFDHVEGIKTVSNGPIAFQFTFHDGFNKGVLKGGRVFILFDTTPGSGPESRGTIRLKGKHIKLFVPDNGDAVYPVQHPNAKTLEVTIPGLTPVNPNGPMSWWAQSKYKGPSGCPTTCTDRAPNSGSIAS